MNQQVWHNIKSTLTFSFYEQVAYLIVGLILTISCNGNALDGFWQLGLQLLQLSTLGMSIATLVDIFLSVVTVTEFIALNQSSEETNQE